MRLIFIILFITSHALAAGELFLIGGGRQTPDLLSKIVEMGEDRILVIPLASQIAHEVGIDAKAEFEASGSRNVIVFGCRRGELDSEKCLSEIKRAKLIFFTGGSQNLLMDIMKNTKSLALIKKRFYDKELSLAGTSAGTAIMSEVMLTGSPLAPYERIEGVRPAMVETTMGFGFLKNVILDQHFLKRNRQNRLLSAVLDRPHLIGIGIDESTGVLFRKDHIEIVGESDVEIYDARKAAITINSSGDYEVKNLQTTRLKPGSKYSY